MSDKVFWSLLGAEVVLWIVLFVVIVMPKMADYDSVSAKLKRQQKDLKEYSRKIDRELPTEDLVEAEKKYLGKWEQEIKRAEEFYSSRVSRFVEGVSSDLSSWSTRYRDGFDLMAKRYRSDVGLEADAELPFTAQEDLDDVDKIVKYERRWKVQNHLVNLVLANRGSTIVELTVDRRLARAGRGGDGDSTSFPVSLKMTIPGNRVVNFVDQIMKHPFIDYSIERLAVSKDRKELLFDVVNENRPEDDEMGEPNVLLLLEMEVHEGDVMSSSEEERG
ncbi:MAG: hypothetical protein CBC13_01920 [Planctomycetia bacterium TMED53]|nr:MAG: hypothetical protein CBC13_01920 [Planctomycetia bacterium TMED53]